MEDLVSASERDVRALEEAGFEVRKLERGGEWSKPASFRKARIAKGNDSVAVDWALDSVALKQEWIAASDQAREEMTTLADEEPDMPIGVAFVDAKGEPGWIRRDASLRLHYPSLRGCWPAVQ